MFERWKLRCYERKLERISKRQDLYQDSEEYKKTSGEARQMIDQELGSELGEAYDPIEHFKTQQALREANRFGIPIPRFRSDNDENAKYWEDGWCGERHHHLSDEGYQKIRSERRAERKARREDRLLWWLPLLSTVAGIIGAASGFLAVLKQFKSGG